MAVVIKKTFTTTRKCWACGREIADSDAFILSMGAETRVCFHLDCAQSVSRRLLVDLADMKGLDYDYEDDE